jgi:hypothetical protein
MTRSFVLVLAAAIVGCVAEVEPGVSEEALRRQQCGGILAVVCPEGYECVDDRRDDCDPLAGGADCGGICRRSRRTRCDYGDPSREYVSRDPDTCAAIRFACESGVAFFDACGCGCEVPAGEACGPTTCASGEVCCNASCGICTPPDGFCTQQACEPVGI